MEKKFFILAVVFSFLATAQQRPAANTISAIPILIRCDDWGMCHSVNIAARQVLEKGFPVSASIMFACPWYQEAVEIAKLYPNVSVGIHLTLNAEWKNYRWGPVTGSRAVPSLVDSLGFFFPSRAKLFGNNPKLSEIEMELRAQIERAIHSGVKIDYVDYHMGAAVQTLETRGIVEKLASEYHLAISRYFDEKDVETGYSAAPENKLDTLLQKMKSVEPGGTKLLVFHIGVDDQELSSLEDLNVFGPKDMSKHRQSELNSLLSNQFQTLIHTQQYRLINYSTLIQEKGLNSMKRPAIVQ
jgi:predicted glycoside hydrolase/deacetylase ChbG (UPF0249 family)